MKAGVLAGLLGLGLVALAGCDQDGTKGAKPAPKISYFDPGFVFVKDKLLLSPETIQAVCLTENQPAAEVHIAIKPEYAEAFRTIADTYEGQLMGFFDGHKIIYSGQNGTRLDPKDIVIHLFSSPEEEIQFLKTIGFENPDWCP